MAFERDVASTADLPNAGKARRYRKAHAVPRFVFRHFGWNWRARSNDGHFAFENIDELGQFVEAELAENMAERIDTRVVLHLEGFAAGFVQSHEFFFAFFGIGVHAAEFVHGKQGAVFTYASLLEDYRPLRIADLYGECAEQQ